MIRLEFKVVIPDKKKPEDFWKVFLKRFSDESILFWQVNCDTYIFERNSLEAVLGSDGFPFVDTKKVICIHWDFATEKETQEASRLLEQFSGKWEMEISIFRGERIFRDIKLTD